jgi:hypothetical protein
MLRAVFARTLRPGVTYEQFKDAWVPGQDAGPYPARASIGRDLREDRKVVTIVELDVTPEQFPSIAPTLFRPDAAERIAELVASTELEGVYEHVMDDSAF